MGRAGVNNRLSERGRNNPPTNFIFVVVAGFKKQKGALVRQRRP